MVKDILKSLSEAKIVIDKYNECFGGKPLRYYDHERIVGVMLVLRSDRSLHEDVITLELLDRKYYVIERKSRLFAVDHVSKFSVLSVFDQLTMYKKEYKKLEKIFGLLIRLAEAWDERARYTFLDYDYNNPEKSSKYQDGAKEFMNQASKLANRSGYEIKSKD